jgi:hypothetical protein
LKTGIRKMINKFTKIYIQKIFMSSIVFVSLSVLERYREIMKEREKRERECVKGTETE